VKKVRDRESKRNFEETEGRQKCSKDGAGTVLCAEPEICER
jgi:hypothetical protein